MLSYANLYFKIYIYIYIDISRYIRNKKLIYIYIYTMYIYRNLFKSKTSTYKYIYELIRISESLYFIFDIFPCLLAGIIV